MKMMRLLLAGLACCATPANAHWQYTRWGMTPTNVIAASSGTVQAINGTENDRVFDHDFRATGTYRTGVIEFTAEFYFANRGTSLAVVRLRPKSQFDCDLLPGQLSETYGTVRPEVSQLLRGYRLTTFNWLDSANGNRILFADFPAIGGSDRSCHIIYRPLNPAGAGGL